MSTMRNSVMLIGRPGAEPEVKSLNKNNKMARVRLAVTESKKNANGEWVSETQWFTIVAWGKIADRVENNVRKGLQVAVEGSLRKVAKMLEDRGIPLKPRPDKPPATAAASASGSSGNESPKAVSPSTNAVAAASAPVRGKTNQAAAATPPATKSAIKLCGTNHVAQAKASDDAAAAAKAFAEYGIKPEENAKRGAMMFERPETREEGLRLLRESARNGSPFALARLSALYYTGDGGVKRDYAKAVKLMEAAASRGFPRFLLPLKEARKAMQREEDLKKKDRPGLWPGLGYPGAIVPYRANKTLQKMLDRYSLTAGVFRRDPIGDAMLAVPDSRKYLLTEEIPYLLFTPKSGSAPVPLVMYFGGTGEQGTDLSAHFRQRTIFEMVCCAAPGAPRQSRGATPRRGRSALRTDWTRPATSPRRRSRPATGGRLSLQSPCRAA